MRLRVCGFPGTVHRGEIDGVGGAECRGEVVDEGAGARVQVRLEDGHDSPARGLCGGQCGRDFRRVMGVIVYDENAFDFAPNLKATIDTAEVGQTGRDVLDIDISYARLHSSLSPSSAAPARRLPELAERGRMGDLCAWRANRALCTRSRSRVVARRCQSPVVPAAELALSMLVVDDELLDR